MSFKVTDLMVIVGSLDPADDSTCTIVSRTTGGAGCVDSIFFQDDRTRHDLSLLKAQLRQVAGRA